LNSVKKTNRLVIVEESWPLASIASEITYVVQKQAFDYLDAPIKRITLPDMPAPYSKKLFDIWYPNKYTVINAIKEVLYI
ncbi:MAG: alpha-ketoacid dehydrogenase subunit beta, partial [Flavobacteriia bacterium]|nr:alpha-ketoacid dehydrogenase subunit beta [Candidatus Bostrichicola ureolyticus]